MGNCECLRGGEEDKHEININFKDKKTYHDDYENTNKGKAKAVNNQFSLIDQDEDEEEDNRKRLQLVSEAKSKDEDDIPIKEDAIEVDEVIEQEPDKNEEEDDYIVTFKKEPQDIISKKKSEVVNIVNKGFNNTQESLKVVEPIQVKIEETKAPNPVLDHSNLDRSNLSGDSDIDDTIFNSAKFSKDIFNLLNAAKLNPSSILDQVKRFQIPKSSKATEESRQEVVNFIESLSNSHKGKSYLWNEKGYSALRPLYQRKSNGENVENNIKELFEGPTVKSHVDSIYEVSGRYDREQTLLCLLLENSSSIRTILHNSTPICSVCSVQSKNKLKTMTCLVLIKKK